MNQVPSDILNVDPQFIEENRCVHLVKLGHIRAKHAPYPRIERAKRRKEVARLHFELGYPAIRIASMMKVDRNTINSDLRMLYRAIGDRNMSANDSYTRFFVRLDLQRGRLTEYLSKENDTQTKLMIERQITDIDLKLLQAHERIVESNITYHTKVAEAINRCAENNKLDYRLINMQEILRLSPDGYESFLNLLRKERVIK